MSAERYTLHADNTDWLDVRDPQGYRNTINQPGAIALIRQQSADIAELRAELAAVVAERDEWKECAMSNLDERDQLRAQLAEYENAPTVAVVWFARNKDGVACSGLDYTDLPPIGTELIARKVKK